MDFAYRNGLQGLNKGLVPMLSGAMELVSRWIAILALSKPFGYVGVCFADPAAWLTTGILLIVTYYVWEMRMREEDTDKIDFTQIGLFVVQLSHG